MTEHLLTGLVSIFGLGIAAQWLAWRFHFPSILLLLVFGFIAGPVTGFLHPDEVLGDILFPFVSLSVALILFEGGLSLKLRELRDAGHVIRNLVSLGTLVTWSLATAGAYFLLGFELPLATLFGAVLIVTGPTVIVPLLRQIRASGRTGSIVKWEGIVNDPIGAIIAVFVFEAILISGFQATTVHLVLGIFLTLADGLIFGGLAAVLLIFLLKQHWIPDYLQNGVTIAMVITAFALSNLVQAESGLFTVTLMGVIVANQKWVSIKPIVEFKEQLGTMLLASLFIILAARLRPEQLTEIGWHSAAYLAALILVVRPVAVWVSTLGTGLTWQEKLFLAWMAPRGIVAAAVTAIFALELAEQSNYAQAEEMVPQMFFIIVGTVAIYGLSAAPLGRWLNLAKPNPQGVLFVGAHAWARKIAAVLHNQDIEVMLVDTNRANVRTARLEGLAAVYASVLSEYFDEEIDFGSLGRLAAMTANDEVNSLAALAFAEHFDRSEVYQLPPKEAGTNHKETVSLPLRGRLLFGPTLTYAELSQRFEAGATLKVTRLSQEFNYSAFQERYGNRAIPLFLIDKGRKLSIFTVSHKLNPQPGHTLISLFTAPAEQPHSAQEELAQALT